MTAFADLLDRLCTERGLTRSALAKRAGYALSTISHAANGSRPSVDLAIRLDQVLCAGGRLLATVPGAASRYEELRSVFDPRTGEDAASSMEQGRDAEVEGDTVNRREMLGVSAFGVMGLPGWQRMIVPATDRIGDRVGTTEVEEVRSLTDWTSGAYLKAGGGSQARTVATRYLNTEVGRLLNGRFTDRVGAQLHQAAAVLAGWVGWMAHDAGHDQAAQTYLARAQWLALAGGDRALASCALQDLSGIAAWAGHGREALALARAATAAGKDSASASVMTCNHLAEARGHALLGDDAACTRALSTAARAYERVRADDHRPEWAGKMAAMTPILFASWHAWIFEYLGRPRQALQYATLADGRSGAGSSSNAALYTLRLARLHGATGDIEQAADLGIDALAMFEMGLRSTRATEAAQRLQRDLTPHQTVAAQEFRQRAVVAGIAAGCPRT